MAALDADAMCLDSCIGEVVEPSQGGTMGQTIAAAMLTVLALASLAPAQPANDDCADATPIAAIPFTDAVDTTAATTEPGDPTFVCHTNDQGQSARSVWYRYTSAAGGSLEVDTFGSDYDTILVAWRGLCGAFSAEAACNQYDLDFGHVGDGSRLIVTLAAGETIYLEVTSDDPGGGNLVVNVKETTAFRVTDEDVYTAEHPDIAAAADGTFLVVWENEDYAIMGRRYCDAGVPLGAAFQISEATAYAERPKVARAGADFVVVWYEGNIRGRRVTGGGTPAGSVFDVNDGYPHYYHFALAGDASGEFVVTWADFSVGGGEEDVVARRFDASDTPFGPAFAVNTHTTGLQRLPEIASDASGNAVIVWESEDQDGSSLGIFGRRVDAAGTPVGGEFQANVATDDTQSYPTVATSPDGSFVVAWHDQSGENCSGYRCVVGRRFAAAGAPLAGDFVVSEAGTEPPSFYVWIDTGRSDDGDFVVSWANEFDFPRARAFEADGTPKGPALQMAYAEHDYQRDVRLGVAGDGDFQVVWEWAPDGSSYRIMGRAVAENPSCPAPGVCPASPSPGCKQPTIAFKGRLAMKDKDPDKGDSLVWKWVRGDATNAAEIGDPLANASYSLCLYDGGNVLISASRVDPGGICGVKPCWKALGTPAGSKGYKYVNKAGNADGVKKLILKPGEQGKAKAIVKAGGAPLDMPAPPLALPVTAQLLASTGTCWSASFDPAGVLKNTAGVFAAKASL